MNRQQGLFGRNKKTTYLKPGVLSLFINKNPHSLPRDETIRALRSEKEKLLKLIEKQQVTPQYEADEQNIEEQCVDGEQHVGEEQHILEEEHVEEEEPSRTELTTPLKKKRNGRGPTMGYTTQKKRMKNDNKKLEVIIPIDRAVAVGPGAKDFVTELSIVVHNHARHNVKNWKEVPDIAKERIIAQMMDTFELVDNEHTRKTIMDEANKLYRYRRNRLHSHFIKFAAQTMPRDVNDEEWEFLVEYFSSEEFKEMSERNKTNKAKQHLKHTAGRKSFQAVSYEARDKVTGKEPNYYKLWELTHTRSNGQWVNNASAEVNDKVKEVVAEKTQEVEEGTDVDPIVNASFVQVMGEKSSYIFGKRFGIKPTSRITKEIEEKIQARAEEERRKRESVENKLLKVETQLEDERQTLLKVETQLEDERQSRRELEARLALIETQLHSRMPNSKNNGISAAIFHTGLDKTTCVTLVNDNQGDLYKKKNQQLEMQKELDKLKDDLSSNKRNLLDAAIDCDKFRSLCAETDAELQATLTKQNNLKMKLLKSSSQGSKKDISEQYADAQNQVLKKMKEDIKARNVLNAAQGTQMRILSEKASLEEKIIALEKKLSEDENNL